MTTPRPTPFPPTTPCARVLIPFVIISDSNDEITTLPVRPAQSSSDRIPALSGYPLDFGDDSSDEDLSDTAESLPAQTASTSIAFTITTTISITITTTTTTTTITTTVAVPLTPEHIEPVGDDIKTQRASLASTMQDMMSLRTRVGLLEQHNVVTRDSLRIARGRIAQS
nr:hypothetical protein [Tanacetum cinerariifolium]